MTIEQAIQRAIEGGFMEKTTKQFKIEVKSTGGIGVYDTNGTLVADWRLGEILLIPSFWQCLGKSMGWVDKDYPNGEMRCNITVNGEKRCDDRYCSYAGFKDPVQEWHRFIDHLAEGKSIEDYFLTLK